MKDKIIVPVIAGPTASGKSDIAFALAKNVGADIISADSRQIYRFLTIGTAKPSPSELATVKHWCVDCIDPNESFSAHEFALRALDIIRQRALCGSKTVICGGTGFYLNALIKGLADHVPVDLTVRARLREMMQTQSPESIFDSLKLVDPESANKIHPHNTQRVVRALEVYFTAGKKFSDYRADPSAPSDIEFRVFTTNLDRVALYKRIDARIDAMVCMGLFSEFDALVEKGYACTAPGMNTIGYAELYEALQTGVAYSSMIDLIKQNSRNYAKRQITWFSHQIKGTALNPNEPLNLLVEQISSIWNI